MSQMGSQSTAEDYQVTSYTVADNSIGSNSIVLLKERRVGEREGDTAITNQYEKSR